MRFRVVSTAASLLAVAPGASFALGLGEIQLRSSLNAPLNADIELTATAEELVSLRTQIASRDTFTRYGLEYPAFLSSIQVRTERLLDGRNVIRLTSSVPMTEPFATLLVEASWASGRNLREYTVLFDPPAFAPAPAAAASAPAPVAAPMSGAGERSAPIARPNPAPVAPVVQAAPAAAASARVNAGEYVVRGGDSLSAIVRRQYGATDTERAMIATYRGNPNAFDGNINRLRAGTVLRLPDSATVAAIDQRTALAEVRQQAAAWREAGPAAPAPAADPRLRLIPPASPGAATGSTNESQTQRDKVTALEAQLAESKRLLELQNAELARLRAGGKPPAAATTPPATPPAPPAAPAQAATPPAEPAPAVVEPAVEKPAEKPAKPAPAPAAAEESGPSILDFVKRFWWAPVGALALIVALLGLRAARRRREESADSLAPFAVAAPQGRDTSSDTMPLRKPFSDSDDPSILVEESGTHERLGARKDTRTVDLDDAATSMSVPALDATAALEQGDPLAEADFHMAYGLYDQAADLVKLAIKREPARRDLKLKLLEVFFVWGNKDQFLQTARELADTRDSMQQGEWEKVVIMGKQLAPEDALFSQSYSGAGPASVDLNLEGGQNLIDFDLHGEPSVSLTSDGGVDLDLGTAVSPESHDFGGLDFVLDDPARGGDELARTATTRQMAQPGLGGMDDAPTQRYAVDGPTIEQPTLDHIGDTLLGKIDVHGGFGGSDQTAELAIDDLGLDLGKFDATGTNASLLDDSQLVRALEAADAPTMLAGLDETQRRLVEDANEANHPTELLPMADFTGDAGATAQISALDIDFDLDSSAETGKRTVLEDGDFSLDLDVGSPEQSSDSEFQRTQRIEPVADVTERDLEPVTMSEVGTKLDLARAYMDMGDPDGARSILREVLQEGSPNQRQEAQRLIDSIPG